ncbi:MAG: Nif3-like dinuclear metal center hexameric protein [Spirochaetales bacterium]|nr:Nif3-like dinuclear metal center hexameric protein [Spirochaetales bacterium]
MKKKELVEYLNNYLKIADFSKADNSLNGLQVEGNREEVKKIAFAVDASLQSFELAQKVNADLLVVHHGLFWGKDFPLVGSDYSRFESLFSSGIGLYAAHLPLDAHSECGNNAYLAKRIGLEQIEEFGSYKGVKIGFKGEYKAPQTIEEIILKMGFTVEDCLSILRFGKKEISKVAIVSGGAPWEVIQAASEDADLYITGDASHSIYHFCKENKINMLSAGHYNTETGGVKMLAEIIARELKIETEFLDIPTGL